MAASHTYPINKDRFFRMPSRTSCSLPKSFPVPLFFYFSGKVGTFKYQALAIPQDDFLRHVSISIIPAFYFHTPLHFSQLFEAAGENEPHFYSAQFPAFIFVYFLKNNIN